MRILFLLTFCCFSTVIKSQNKFESEWLSDPVQYKDQLDLAIGNIAVVSVVEKDSIGVWLENGYAKSFIVNPEEYAIDLKKILPDTISIVFTLYPKNVDKWYIMYHELLSRRLNELFKLNPYLNDAEIAYKIILQDSCETEEDAIELFHGFHLSFPAQSDTQVITLNQKEFDTLQTLEYNPSSRFIASDSIIKYRQIITDLDKFNSFENARDKNDSTVYEAFEKSDFDSIVAVIDWTGSMYHHGSQALLWHIYHLDQSYLLGFTFFNDGDDKEEKEKLIGSTGGIWPVYDRAPKVVFKTMQKVHKKGKGGTKPENDIEALLVAQEEFPHAKSIVLIADNYSCIRDFSLLDSIHKKVHVILPDHPQQINLMYLDLAYRTQGTIRTSEGIVLDFTENQPISFVWNSTLYFVNQKGYFQTIDDQYCSPCFRYYPIENYFKEVQKASSEKTKETL